MSTYKSKTGKKPMKIVRVTKTEFELEDGRVFEHVEPLEVIPSLAEFQKIYDSCFKQIHELMENKD